MIAWLFVHLVTLVVIIMTIRWLYLWSKADGSEW